MSARDRTRSSARRIGWLLRYAGEPRGFSRTKGTTPPFRSRETMRLLSDVLVHPISKFGISSFIDDEKKDSMKLNWLWLEFFDKVNSLDEASQACWTRWYTFGIPLLNCRTRKQDYSVRLSRISFKVMEYPGRVSHHHEFHGLIHICVSWIISTQISEDLKRLRARISRIRKTQVLRGSENLIFWSALHIRWTDYTRKLNSTTDKGWTGFLESNPDNNSD